MGFGSEIRILKKYPNRKVSLKDALHVYSYCKFLKWIETDWCKKQIENGHEFKFEDTCTRYKEMGIPKCTELIDFYMNVVNEENNNNDDENCVAFWCSTGIYIHELIQNNSTSTFDGGYEDYYEFSDKTIEELEKTIVSWEDEHKFVPVTAIYGLKRNKDDEITCIPIEGVEVETEDGFSRKVYGEDELFITSKYCDSAERYAYSYLKEALNNLKCIDRGNYYIYYFGGN